MKNPPSAYLEKLRSVLDHGGGRKVQCVSACCCVCKWAGQTSGRGNTPAPTADQGMRPERKCTAAIYLLFKEDYSLSHCWRLKVFGLSRLHYCGGKLEPSEQTHIKPPGGRFLAIVYAAGRKCLALFLFPHQLRHLDYRSKMTDLPSRVLSVQEARPGIYAGPPRAGNLPEDQSHWVSRAHGAQSRFHSSVLINYLTRVLAGGLKTSWTVRIEG